MDEVIWNNALNLMFRVSEYYRWQRYDWLDRRGKVYSLGSYG